MLALRQLASAEPLDGATRRRRQEFALAPGPAADASASQVPQLLAPFEQRTCVVDPRAALRSWLPAHRMHFVVFGGRVSFTFTPKESHPDLAAVVYLKNNLTLFEKLVLRGAGGSGAVTLPEVRPIFLPLPRFGVLPPPAAALSGVVWPPARGSRNRLSSAGSCTLP